MTPAGSASEVANHAKRMQTGPMPVAATPMAFARAIVLAYHRWNRSPVRALEQAQITPSQLAEPQGRITARQMELLSAAAMQELDDEGLGAFDRRLPWGSYGLLARASLTAPTLGVALRRWCRHHGLLTDSLRLALVVHDGMAAIALDRLSDLHGQDEFSQVHVLRNAHGLACWYVDSRVALLEARFPFPAPPHADAYPLMFPAPLHFEAGRAEIRFDARYLDLPIRRDERAMRQMLQRALPLTVLQYRRDRLLVPRVRQALLTAPERSHNAEGLAALLALSPRTLHRQLREEGASLQQLKDEVRRERATDLLLRSTRPIKQIAAEVGFRNEKSFIRAFRGWTGQAPGELRQGARAA